MKKLYSIRFDYTQTPQGEHISGHQNIANFVNNKGISKNDIVAITSDADNRNYTLFYYYDIDSSPKEKT